MSEDDTQATVNSVSSSSSSSAHLEHLSTVELTLRSIRELTYFTRPSALSMPLSNEEKSLLDEIDKPGKWWGIGEGDNFKITSHHQPLQPDVLELLERHILELASKLQGPLSQITITPNSTLSPDEGVAMYQFGELTDAREDLLSLGGISVEGDNNQQTHGQSQPEEETDAVITQEMEPHRYHNRSE
ncbi:hypothetical protein TREMEDRAFT_61749 [Tremella mesenterica DSM 1558]|uniref:uncharacterized protein n=1 Tax=Tremella mesenterica (strain ATCC 24925 / CBS 8224 / DSM 1558 / NBRC 9311 / NRRL Y-6157 / RJB 2259-6 / UBC 559-6) TaxID=578456 RepID=UPI0003F49107|nr:uncharacterized protein TREMEDRAFT_61749 [Tremella mesenterica DSM 1558]EIW69984.1 hypothetical protein TREMEDRAFT_61749 [Tremella mesenterica DSM 1558]